MQYFVVFVRFEYYKFVILPGRCAIGRPVNSNCCPTTAADEELIDTASASESISFHGNGGINVLVQRDALHW